MTLFKTLDNAVLQTIAVTRRSSRLVRTHSRAVSISALVVLGGLSATAFGIAPLAPDAADLPQSTIEEHLPAAAAADIDAQLEALAAHSLSLDRSELTRSGDTIDSLLGRLNIVDAEASAFLRNDPLARKLLAGRAGKMVQARSNASGRLEQLVVRSAAEDAEQFSTHFTRLRVVRADKAPGRGFESSQETVPLATEVRLGSGTIRQSLFAAAEEARIPDTVAIQVAEIFATDIDFHRELRRGDSFNVIYEALTADGEPINWGQASGRVLATEFVNKGNKHAAIWFKSAGSPGSYFDMNGKSKRRSFLASPLEFSRVTSGFSLRFHPILQTWRQHNGVDYGAPIGTPVRSVGDGVVQFAGTQGGYGNVVEVRHGANRVTLYAHLSRVDVQQGQRIEQGQSVGAVGATGWATGPHLHFEVKINGENQDPLIVAKTSESISIEPTARIEFARLSRAIRSQLDAAQSVVDRRHYVE